MIHRAYACVVLNRCVDHGIPANIRAGGSIGERIRGSLYAKESYAIVGDAEWAMETVQFRCIRENRAIQMTLEDFVERLCNGE